MKCGKKSIVTLTEEVFQTGLSLSDHESSSFDSKFLSFYNPPFIVKMA